MSTFRVTQRSMGDHALANLQASLARTSKLQDQLSSGKQISRASDSPTGTATSLQLRSDLRANTQYVRNADDGVAYLATIDTALGNAMDQARAARDLTVRGMSTGSNDGNARAGIAAEVAQLRKTLMGVANTTYLGRPVFGGTTAGSTAYDANGTFTGDSGQVLRTVAKGQQVQVDANGTQVFGDGTTSPQLFTVLNNITQHLTSAPSLLAADLTQLDTAMTKMATSRTDVGARYNRLDTMRSTASDQVINVKNSLSDVENIDLPATIVNLQLQQTAYQAALSATAKVIQPSLLNFLS